VGPDFGIRGRAVLGQAPLSVPGPKLKVDSPSDDLCPLWIVLGDFFHEFTNRPTHLYDRISVGCKHSGIARDFCVENAEIKPELQHSLRGQLKLPLGRKIAVFAGRFVENKGLYDIRAIAASLPSVLFVMCGSGPMNPSDWGLTNVSVRGPMSSTDLRELFRASDFLLLPSTEGGFPLVVPEAMACGLPCCILRQTWLAFGRAEDYFVLLERDRLVNAIVEYLDSPFSFCKRRALARYAKENWDWDKSSAEYLSVYRQVFSREREE
jgi:glycosyltransferase involved in cell wall biosynthesis